MWEKENTKISTLDEIENGTENREIDEESASFSLPVKFKMAFDGRLLVRRRMWMSVTLLS